MTLKFVLVLILVEAMALVANAQQPPGDQPVYSGAFGGGIATTGGNTNTQNFNLAFDITRDPKKRSAFKAKAVYLRANQDDILHVNRTAVTLRNEWTVSGKTFVFGQLDYLRDEFKEIIFLWA